MCDVRRVAACFYITVTRLVDNFMRKVIVKTPCKAGTFLLESPLNYLVLLTLTIFWKLSFKIGLKMQTKL